jgi:hypothetical protein
MACGALSPGVFFSQEGIGPTLRREGERNGARELGAIRRAEGEEEAGEATGHYCNTMLHACGFSSRASAAH